MVFLYTIGQDRAALRLFSHLTILARTSSADSPTTPQTHIDIPYFLTNKLGNFLEK
jgi:hypothetical protein